MQEQELNSTKINLTWLIKPISKLDLYTKFRLITYTRTYGQQINKIYIPKPIFKLQSEAMLYQLEGNSNESRELQSTRCHNFNLINFSVIANIRLLVGVDRNRVSRNQAYILASSCMLHAKVHLELEAERILFP